MIYTKIVSPQKDLLTFGESLWDIYWDPCEDPWDVQFIQSPITRAASKISHDYP